MNILLHICWGLKPGFVGGTERFVLDLAHGIKRRGGNPFIVCSNLEAHIQVEDIDVFGAVPTEYRKRIERYGYANDEFFRHEVIRSPASVNSLRRFSDFTTAQLSGFNYDVAHLNSFLYSCLMNPQIGSNKIVITNHEDPDALRHFWGNSIVQLLRKASENPNCILRKVRDLYMSTDFYSKCYSAIINAKVHCIQLGIDLGHFVRYPKKDIALRRVYADDDETVIVIPSRFEMKQKGIDLALNAIKLLTRKKIKMKFIFCGLTEQYRSNLGLFWRMAKEYRIEDRVTIEKFTHEEMPKIYNVADITLALERFASFGLSVCESLALGIPTVLTPIPSFLEIANAYRHAYFTKSISAVEAAKTITHLITNNINQPDTEEAERFRQAISIEACVDKYLSIYNSIAGRDFF